MAKTERYILAEDGKTPIECDNLTLWGKWFEGAERRVARWNSPDGDMVSTVFLGLDHNFDGGKPLLWETLTQSKDIADEKMERYETYEEAINGHERAIIAVETKLKAKNA